MRPSHNMDDISYFDELPHLLNPTTSNDMDFDTYALPMFDPNNYSPDFQFGINNNTVYNSPIYDLNNNTNNSTLLTLPQLSPPPLPPIHCTANSQTQINLQSHVQTPSESQQRDDIFNLNRYYSSLRLVDFNNTNYYQQPPHAPHAFLYNIQNIDDQFNSNSNQQIPFHKSRFYIDPETQMTPKTDGKTVKTEQRVKRKQTTKKTKTKKRKRKRKEMDDDDDCADNYKRQKTDISDLSQYILETMSRKKANKLFNNMVANGSVIFSDKKNENYCHVDECNKSFGAKCHLKRHCLESHIGRRFKCIYPACRSNMQFKQKSQCKEHIMNTHGNGAKDKQWKCYICPDTFTRWNGVKRHLILVRCKILKNNYSKTEIKNVIQNAKSGKCKDICKNY